MQGRERADRLVAHRRQRRLVRGRAATEQRQPALEPRFLVLLHELHGEPADEERQHGVGVALDLGEERREVVGVERRPDLLDDPPALFLEDVLEAADRLVAERVVHADRRDLPVLRVLDEPLREGVHRLARGPAGADDPLRGLALRDVIGGDDGIGRRDLLAIDVGLERVADVREQPARQDVDLVLLDELARLVERGRRVALAVLDDELERPPRRDAADLVQVQLGAVHHVLADLREGAGERREHAEPDRAVLGLCHDRRQQGGEPGAQHESGERPDLEAPHHGLLSL